MIAFILLCLLVGMLFFIVGFYGQRQRKKRHQATAVKRKNDNLSFHQHFTTAMKNDHTINEQQVVLSENKTLPLAVKLPTIRQQYPTHDSILPVDTDSTLLFVVIQTGISPVFSGRSIAITVADLGIEYHQQGYLYHTESCGTLYLLDHSGQGYFTIPFVDATALALCMPLLKTKDDVVLFDRMITLAKQLADRLGGQLMTEDYHLLSNVEISALRQRIMR